MKFLSDRIDRFCYKHPRFGISNLMLAIAVSYTHLDVYKRQTQGRRADDLWGLCLERPIPGGWSWSEGPVLLKD